MVSLATALIKMRLDQGKVGCCMLLNAMLGVGDPRRGGGG